MGKSICGTQNLNVTLKKKTFNEIAILWAKSTIVVTNWKQAIKLYYFKLTLWAIGTLKNFQIDKHYGKKNKLIPP